MAEKNIPAESGPRRIIGRLIGAAIVLGALIAVVVTLLQWETRPQTDDATVRANFVGIAPQVSGHIIELHVRDNQQVKEGDLLFVIDPRPYEIALERARATLLLARTEVDGLKNGAATAVAGISKAEAQLNASAADVTRREMDPVVADAEIARLEAQFQHADDHLKRLEPLLPEQFVTADRVEEARTKRATALAGLDEARARKRAAVATVVSARAQHVATGAALQQARTERARAQDAIGQIEGINARLAAAEAAVHAAELDLSYCRVRAPFTGLVVNMNISNGAFARARCRGVHLGGYAYLVRRCQLPRDAASSYSCGRAGGHLSAIAAEQALPRHRRWARLGRVAGERHKRRGSAARRTLSRLDPSRRALSGTHQSG